MKTEKLTLETLLDNYRAAVKATVEVSRSNVLIPGLLQQAAQQEAKARVAIERYVNWREIVLRRSRK